MEPNFQPSVQQLEAILQDPKDSYTYETNDPLRTWVAILIRNALDSWYGKLSPLQIKNSAQVELGKTLIKNVLAKGKRDFMVRKQATLCVGKIGKSNLNANLSNLFEDLNLHIQNVIAVAYPQPSSPALTLRPAACFQSMAVLPKPNTPAVSN
ncbi:hypothetical protein PGTUg99_022252 [Puccinia graminis f. sp. tritici]|uniref:Uncharacterized protein n=1 Tax=Puccinia graminis f. sp. tritici TaxID=56615 RepID=A0A5B0SJ22_PUCGR|nr:hypothetical protein PGTUg99_022252 [Puccinia graminis f. sp. tritici]